MELLHLKYFLTVAKIEHMTKSAKELRIAQPALSKIISSLEKELGLELFDRKGKTIKLNDNGKFFYEKVSSSLSILDDCIKDLQYKQHNKTKEIKFLALAASSLVTEILIEFRTLYPDINFELIQSINTLSIYDNYDYDLCIYSSDDINIEKDSIYLLKEEILLAVPTNHTLSNQNSIHLSQVSNQKFISLGQGNLKLLTDSFCRKAGFIPNIVFESNNPSTVRDLIAFGQGVSFIPQVSWRFQGYKSIKFLHLDYPECNRTLRLRLKESENIPSHILLFKNFIIDYFSNYN